MLQEIKQTAAFIREKANFKPQVGIVLGTGLGGLVNEINILHTLPYESIPGFPLSTVEGHSGKLILGTLGGKNVVAMQGRFHFYEGYTMQQVTFPIRVLKFLGVETLFLSNASGGVNPDFKVGDLMVLNDHINLFPMSPLIGTNIAELGPRFPDMSEAYNKELIAKALSVGKKLNIPLQQGVYAGLSGPCFETPAEYRYIRRIGGDAVGMSTVPEVIVARHMGLPCFAISIITDLGIEGQVVTVSHEEVQLVARAAEKKMTQVFKEMITGL